jgi:hypothetical protein
MGSFSFLVAGKSMDRMVWREGVSSCSQMIRLNKCTESIERSADGQRPERQQDSKVFFVQLLILCLIQTE